MIDPIAVSSIYNFSNIFERALKQVFEAQGIKAFTSQFIPSQSPEQDAENVSAGYEILDFQKDRPRAEIFFTPGAGYGRFKSVRMTDIVAAVETAWAGTYQVRAITKADIIEHNAFVTMARFLLATMVPRINNIEPMTNHAIANFPKDQGSTEKIEDVNGDFNTVLIYEIDFSVQANAWAALQT